jgi:CO/xanthine dehydrogenase FAD-binding subunit
MIETSGVGEFCRPADLAEALAFLAAAPEGERTWLMAGGTDLMVGVNSRTLEPRRVLDIWDLQELRGVELDGQHLILGALTTYTQMIEDPRIRQAAPMLRDAALEVGAVQIQNRGTLGGNIANGSPAGDTLPVLAVHEAQVHLRSAGGGRWVPFLDFYTGYRANVMRRDELIDRVRIPAQKPAQRHFWRKMGTRRAQSISKVMLAAFAETKDGVLTDLRLGFGSVAPTVIRARQTEAALLGKRIDAQALETARAAVQQDVRPIDDVRSTERFRRKVSENLVLRFLRGLAQPA